jgi:hypothetical protein
MKRGFATCGSAGLFAGLLSVSCGGRVGTAPEAAAGTTHASAAPTVVAPPPAASASAGSEGGATPSSDAATAPGATPAPTVVVDAGPPPAAPDTCGPNVICTIGGSCNTTAPGGSGPCSLACQCEPFCDSGSVGDCLVGTFRCTTTCDAGTGPESGVFLEDAGD